MHSTPFVFNTIDVVNATDRGPVAYDLSRRMSATWATFARTSRTTRPSRIGLPIRCPSERR
jgi:hypothetical protein